jgi:DNA-binding MarR family transcriptional regulator
MPINESRSALNHAVPQEQARAFVGLLQSLLRELTAGSSDPAVELPLAQLRVCRVLCSGRQSISAISREIGVSLSAVTQIGNRLERARLVDRVADGGDRRIRCLQLTRRGEKLLRLHDEERIRHTAAMLAQLTPKTRVNAAAVMKILARAAAAARNSNGDHRPRRKRATKAKAMP